MTNKYIELHQDDTVLIVSSLNGKYELLQEVSKLSEQYQHIIINGNLFSEIFNKSSVELLNSNIVYCVGNLDYSNLKNYKEHHDWLFSLPNIVTLKYNSSTYVICSGGYYKGMEGLAPSFITKPWHENYGGNAGYIISNNPLSDKPAYYNFSCHIGSQHKVFCQVVRNNGLQETFSI